VGIGLKSILIATGKSYVGKCAESLLSGRSGMYLENSFFDSDAFQHKFENSWPNIVILDETLLNSTQVELLQRLSGYSKMRVLVLGVTIMAKAHRITRRS
jgi:hypothetical protein